jgi:zinc/manganese transport system permease protein
VAATAATVLVVDRSPQGAEHVKKMLIGNILTVDVTDVTKLAVLYAAIAICHWLARRPLLAVSGEAASAGRSAAAVSLWDFFFFVSFGLVVTSSVATAGVLLVFSFLIVPAVIGSMFAHDLRPILLIAWSVGILASAIGLAGSLVLDLPTGATMVTTFALVLVPAGLAKALLFVPAEQARRNRTTAVRAAVVLLLAIIFVSCCWLIANPQADQPLLAMFEHATGLDPARFLKASDRATYESAARDTMRFETEVERLNTRERVARYDGSPLADDEVRHVGSYQRTFNEMAQGERFVQQVLRGRARERERWLVGLPFALLSLLGLGIVARPLWRRRVRSS